MSSGIIYPFIYVERCCFCHYVLAEAYQIQHVPMVHWGKSGDRSGSYLQRNPQFGKIL